MFEDVLVVAKVGKVVVYSGGLLTIKDEAGLAALMSEKIAYIIARHDSEQISGTLFALSAAIPTIGMLVASLFLPNGWMVVATCLALFSASVWRFQPGYGTRIPETDYIVMTIMSLAGYDPRGAIYFLQRMNDFKEWKQKMLENSGKEASKVCDQFD